MEKIIENTEKASKIHKQIRQDLKDYVKPEIKLIDICKFIENRIRSLTKDTRTNEINNGIAFPTGVSLNNIAAHWTPIKKTDTTILNNDDLLKIDFGVHYDGCIVDSAFTWSNNEKYNPLLDASKEAVDAIIKNVGVDSTISSLGEISEEVISSYEIEINGVLIPIKPINNLCGHSIKPWTIHAGKLIKPIKNNDMTRIEDNDILAVEIFTSTGSGTTVLDNKSSHYMLKPDYNINNVNNLKFPKSKKLLSVIKNNFKTLPFTQRYLDFYQSDIKHYGMYLNDLFMNGILNSYPALIDPTPNCLTAQFEHTILVSEDKKLNFTKGSDY